MSKGRFTSHSQHPLTACVPRTVKLRCWDTPPTTGGRGGGGTLTVRGPRGATHVYREHSVLQGGGGTHTHTCNWSDAFRVCWHWAHVTTDDLMCDNSNSKQNTRSHWRNVQFDLVSATFHQHEPQHLSVLPSNTETVNTQRRRVP